MIRRSITLCRWAAWAGSNRPRLAAFLLLVLLLIAVCYARSADRLPLWLVIAAFFPVAAAIAVLIEYGGALRRDR